MKQILSVSKTAFLLLFLVLNLPLQAASVFDDFEPYPVGSNLIGQGGWAGMADNPKAGASISDAFSASPKQSVGIGGTSDIVHPFAGVAQGRWTLRMMQYVPSSSKGVSYLSLLNTYRSPYGPGDLDRSVALQINMDGGLVVSDLGGGAAAPLVKDKWVEIRCEVDLDSNSVSEYYDGKLLATHPWQGTSGVPGLNEIQALELSGNGASPVYYDSLGLYRYGVGLTVEVGRRSLGCTRFGICSITIDISLSERAVPTAASWENGRLQLNFLAVPPDKSDVLVIDEDIVLDSATSRALGYEQVTVKAGQYPVDYSVNPHGQVSPNTTAQGLGIWVKIGIPSLGSCNPGFGICSIGLGNPPADAARAAVGIRDHRLQLDFLSDPPFKTNLFSLEQDLALDPSVARTLGYDRVTLRAGQYAVDYSENPHGRIIITIELGGIVITVETGRGTNCTGYGICSITIDASLRPRSVPVVASWEKGRLHLDYLADPPDKSDVLAIDADIVLDGATSQALGYEHVTVKAGLYPVDYSVNPHGHVSPDVVARGIVITIDVGRPSQNCRGFGICITVEIPLSLRAVPTAANWDNGRLHLDFLTTPPDKSDVLVVEQDVVLDSATSRALGYERVTIKAGQYPVDYTVNPHGHVSPDVVAQGLGIWIKVGIRRAGECTPGFGICSIGLGNPPADALRAAVGIHNGHLQLDFLNEPPGKTNMLVLEQDLALDNEVARVLGYDQVVLRAGQYPVGYSDNPNGRVFVPIGMRGIVITIETGRGISCTGFGICSITIDASLSLRAVPAVASWEKDRLHLNYLLDPPDKSDVLVVEKDVVLDSATSRALGYEHVTVKAGQYPVDYTTNPHGHVSPDVEARGIVITLYIGKPSSNCRGFGFCGITIETSLSDRAVPAAASWENGRLHLNNLAEPPEKGDVLVVEKDLVLDSATSRALGYEHVTVKAGQYPVDYTMNPHGHVSPDVVARSIVVTVDFGLPSQKCRGFGICSITVEIPLSLRAVPTAANWESGRLHLDFLGTPPDKSDVLVVENDVVLDSATSRALGYEHVTIKAGQYMVDYTVNPHGHVSPDVVAQGLTIWVRFGWPTAAGGCNRGFSFCDWGTGNPPFDRVVQASASLSNGQLQLSFLSEPPDKTNVLVLEQDLELDKGIARSLGYDGVTVRAGKYEVDYSANPHGVVTMPARFIGIVITVETGRGTNCQGFGICSVRIDTSFTLRSVPAVASWENGRLQLNYLADPPDKTDVLVIDQDIMLDSATSRALGYEHIAIKAGAYPVDYTVNSHGHVTPDVTARGIIITVDVGRRSEGCRGFGICSITIEIPLSLRGVPTAASWENGRLHLNFLAAPPDKGGVLVIDEDIVLDNATSRALGYEHVTVKAGQYPVDYTVNPNGQVSPEVVASGLGIWVKIGLPKAGGCVPGFGICSIVFGNAPADAVRAAVAIQNGQLQLDLLSEVPGKTNGFTLEQDLALDPGIARRLGYGQVTLRAGQYAVDYSENPLGRIIITVELGGIVITVETGRGTNCTGFGICSITVESRQSPRSVPAVASWEKGRLHLSYLSDPPDKSDVLVVDKDVLLDSATSRALGYEHVMVKAGQYPVDYSANPHGHVSPDVVARGIVITIYFGKPSANCRGFGFCDITIELSLSDRAVPAAATWENGRLHLSNLAEPPDKSDVLVVEKDIVLDSATSRALGYEQVTVKAGQYPMDYTTNPHGHVSPDVVARGIVITIYFGKPSANCRGFGFCDITIEPSLSDRAVPAAATWDNGRLHLSNLAEPPDKSDVLVVEKDIVLDSATSRALGHEQVTVKAGQYPVDYSAGTYGQVAADSITRQMDIGFAPGGGLSITWPNGWILQEAVEMGGPWVNTADQTSPATIQPDSSRKFYRLVSP